MEPLPHPHAPAQEDRSPGSLAARAAAILGPLLVLALAVGWLTGEDTRPPSPQGLVNDAALAKARTPGIVVVGNSKSASDVDAKALAKAMGYDRPVANVLTAGSSAPAWYAMLEQRVFAQGYRPQLVIVYGQLGAMLRTEVEGTGERKGVEGQLSSSSAVLDAKVLGNSAGAAGRARRRGTAAHDALLSTLRDLAVGVALSPASADTLAARGKALAEPALGRMFGDTARFTSGAAARVVPVAEAQTTRPMTAGKVLPPEETLIPDIVALARAHDARVVFVRAPLPPATAFTDALPPETERAALDLFNELGVSFVDVHQADLPSNAYRDNWHLGVAGRAQLTAALAEALISADVLNGGVVRARAMPVATEVVRTGTPPAVPPLELRPVKNKACAFRAVVPAFDFLSEDTLFQTGFGYSTPLVVEDASGPLTPHASNKAGDTCAGEWRHRRTDLLVAPRANPPGPHTAHLAPEPGVENEAGEVVWWVYPETATEWRYAEAWPDADVTVSIAARAIRGADATLSVGDQRVPLVADGRRLVARLAVPAPPPPWNIRVEAGPDTWLVIDELLVGESPATRLAGVPAATLLPLVTKPTPRDAPPPLTLGEPTTEGALTRIPVPDLAHVSDAAVDARLDYPCSPIQVGAESEGDVWIKGHIHRGGLKAGRRGYGHIGDSLLLAPPSEEMPAGPYRARLDPSRKCAAGYWLYPNDRLNWATTARDSTRLDMGADMVAIEAVAFVPEGDPRAEATLRVRLASREPKQDQSFEFDIPFSTTAPVTTVCRRLPSPFPPGVRFDFTLESPDPDAWFVVWTAEIAESEHRACDAQPAPLAAQP